MPSREYEERPRALAGVAADFGEQFRIPGVIRSGFRNVAGRDEFAEGSADRRLTGERGSESPSRHAMRVSTACAVGEAYLPKPAVWRRVVAILSIMLAGLACSSPVALDPRSGVLERDYQKDVDDAATATASEVRSALTQALRETLESWQRSPGYQAVRSQVLSVSEPRAIARIEFGPVGRYYSVWIVDSVDGTFLFATGFSGSEGRQWEVARDDWDRLETLVRAGPSEWKSGIDFAGADLEGFFVGWNDSARDMSCYVELFPSPNKEERPVPLLVAGEILEIASRAAGLHRY